MVVIQSNVAGSETAVAPVIEPAPPAEQGFRVQEVTPNRLMAPVIWPVEATKPPWNHGPVVW